MRILVLLVAMLATAMGANWAVLTAGSNNYYNYRHQADVFHAYQVLLKRGFAPSNILVLAFDDIAQSKGNPFPGHVYNKPTYKQQGVDVYEGVKIDYRGANVNPKVFMSVLLGNQEFLVGKGSGRVLNSTAEDNVFLFFSDHGSPGSISFPDGFLYADQFVATLTSLQGRFKKLLVYLETCESGSMFGMLPVDASIYALSAADESESSWATYCSPDDVINGKHLGTCLGDLFSVSFIEDLENSYSDSDTLQMQFEKVKARTTESKVMQWGDLSFAGATLNDFFGSLRKSNGKINAVRNLIREKKVFEKTQTYHVKINYLLNLYKTERTPENFHLLNQEMNHMRKMDSVFFHLKEALHLTGKYRGESINYQCLRESVEFFESNCAKLEDYNLQYMKLLAENCEGFSSDRIKGLVLQHCH